MKVGQKKVFENGLFFKPLANAMGAWPIFKNQIKGASRSVAMFRSSKHLDATRKRAYQHITPKKSIQPMKEK